MLCEQAHLTKFTASWWSIFIQIRSCLRMLFFIRNAPKFTAVWQPICIQIRSWFRMLFFIGNPSVVQLNLSNLKTLRFFSVTTRKHWSWKFIKQSYLIYRQPQPALTNSKDILFIFNNLVCYVGEVNNHFKRLMGSFFIPFFFSFFLCFFTGSKKAYLKEIIIESLPKNLTVSR